MKPVVNVFWFRRDLRLEDNAGLYHALKGEYPVLPLFIFDKNILDQLENKADRRVEFIRDALMDMQEILTAHESSLVVRYSTPELVFKEMLEEYDVRQVFTNRDYEPYATERDENIKDLLQQQDISFHPIKDHVIFEKDEVLKDNGEPYTVFTPYSKKWKEKLAQTGIESFNTKSLFSNFYKQSPKRIPSLDSMGFKSVQKSFPSKELQAEIIKHYNETRDFPALEKGTSRLGVHLRFGTISIRKLLQFALEKNETYVNELIWRDFYQMILWHFPKVGNGAAFKAEYENIKWRNNEDEFEKWCNGNTGYPIVDAGMRELNETGYMHNRVRMIVASFLAKHLLIDWRWGEAYFAEKLLDFDLAANNGGWQWAAGCGCDAAPYFRIFNPHLQTEKFDKDHKYIKKWVPEYQEFSYPKPIVDHKEARERALKVYGEALKK